MKTQDNKSVQDKSSNSHYHMLGNVSIAKFMGIEPIKAISEHSRKEYYYYNNAEMKDYEALPNYNESWDFLMPVVEKINKRDWVTLFSDECKIHALQNREFEDIKVVNEGMPLIKTVFEAIMKYVEWYSGNVA